MAQKQLSLVKGKTFYRLTNNSASIHELNRIVNHSDVFDGMEITLLMEAISGMGALHLTSKTVSTIVSNINLGQYRIDNTHNEFEIVVVDDPPDSNISSFHYKDTTFDTLTFAGSETDIINAFQLSDSVNGEMIVTINFSVNVPNTGGGTAINAQYKLYGGVGAGTLLATFGNTIEDNGGKYSQNFSYPITYTAGDQLKFTAENVSAGQTFTIDSNSTALLINSTVLRSPMHFGKKALVKLMWNEDKSWWQEISRVNLLS